MSLQGDSHRSRQVAESWSAFRANSAGSQGCGDRRPSHSVSSPALAAVVALPFC